MTDRILRFEGQWWQITASPLMPGDGVAVFD